MDSITLSKATIKAINEYAREYQPEDDVGFYRVEDVRFHHDGCDIYVDFEIYGRWIRWSETHNEVPPPNVEHFSEWAYVGHDITNIVAYDQDGEEVTITNENEL